MIGFMIVGLITAFLIFIFKFADGDLTLLWKNKMGKPIGDLKGKVVWITGASSGIGEALANLLASHKCKLVLSGTNRPRLRKVKQECKDKYGLTDEDILIMDFDMKNFKVHEDKFKCVMDYFGQVDVLVHNAGRSQRCGFLDIDMDVHKEMFDINVFGAISLTKVVLPHFLDRKTGQIVVTSSTAGIFGVPFSSTYTATKHALHGYFETIRSEYSRQGIDVTIVCPGPVVSNILENCFTGKLGEYGLEVDPANKAVKMSTNRCAHLMAVAIVNKLDHVWITSGMVLIMHYIAQYMPSFFRRVLVKMIPESYVKNLRDPKKQN